MSARTLTLLAVAALAVSWPWLPDFTVTELNYIGLYSLVAVGLVMLTGVGGMTSFGQAAFVGLGAYATAWLSTSPWVAQTLGGVLPAAWLPWIGLPLGLLLGATVASLGAAWMLARPAPAGGWAGLWRHPLAALRPMARQHKDFPLLNTPHAFMGALQDTLTLVLIAAWTGDAAAGFWALALRYLKAPATLIGGALSQTLYPRLLKAQNPDEARTLVRQAMLGLAAIAAPLAVVLLAWGPDIFTLAFGTPWAQTGELARALAPYIAVHFIASPLSVVTMAWGAQAWALRLALAGQCLFFAGLVTGLHLGGLTGAGWGVSASMLAYFAYYFWALAHWKNWKDWKGVPHESHA